MSKGNYFFLGIAISYLIVTIVQFNIDGVINASVFVTVAFVSFELTVLEAIKIASDNFVKANKSMIKVAKERCLEIENILSIIEKCPVLEEETHKLQNEKTYMIDIIKTKEQSKIIRFLKNLYSKLLALQIVICMVQIIVTPLKIIPYDIITTRMLNIVTLFTFSVMFFSYFLSSIGNDIDERMKIKWSTNQKTSEYYLNILKLNFKEQEEKQGVI